jgi:putative holliday junction resolvase
MSAASVVRRILGIDYGTKRIGIAVSDPLRIIAKGVRTVQNSPRALEEITNICREYDPEKIVVGYPLTLNGDAGASVQEVNKFIARLEAATHLEIVRVDERFTSVIAQQTLIDMGVKKKQRQMKGTIDMIAAALILQNYLDQLGSDRKEQI